MFFDLFEDGRPDILTVNGTVESGFKMTAYTNTSQDSDAYFIKVYIRTTFLQILRLKT